MSIYNRDSSLPYWKNNVAIEDILEDFANDGKMPGHFEAGVLPDHAFFWTFTPGHDYEPALIFPVYNQRRLADILAIASHDHRVSGTVTGAGQFIGDFANREDRTLPIVLNVHDTAASWLASDCEGVLPLSRSFYPLMNFADSIVARDEEHAEHLANEVFIYPEIGRASCRERVCAYV
jgi:hypothetical protein